MGHNLIVLKLSRGSNPVEIRGCRRSYGRNHVRRTSASFYEAALSLRDPDGSIVVDLVRQFRIEVSQRVIRKRL